MEREYKGKSVIEFPSEYTVVDIETTGLSTEYDHIIEIGALKVINDEVVESFQSLVQPPVCYGLDDDDNWFSEYVSEFITELTGITNEMLADAPTIDIVLPEFLEFVGGSYVLGHNVGFDINFLYDATQKVGLPCFSNDWINTLRFSKKLFPNEKHHRLCDLVERLDIAPTGAHRALADCYTTLEAYKEMKGMITDFDEFKNSFKRNHNRGYNLKASDIIGDASLNNPESPLYEKYVVFTGALEKFVRKEAMQIVANLGGINQDSVTKKTNFLILGDNSYCSTIKDGKSTKQKKAEELIQKGYDLQIMPESVFYDMILGDE